MFSSTSGRSIAGLRMLPASPPVQVTTMTSWPASAYLAVVAAPLLDSSSGCACTVIRRSAEVGTGSDMGAVDVLSGLWPPMLGRPYDVLTGQHRVRP